MLYHMHESLFITHFPSLVIGISFFWAFPYFFHNSLSLPIIYPKNGFKSIIESFQSSPFPPPERVINVTTNKINNIQKRTATTTTTSFLSEQSIFSHIIPRSILSVILLSFLLLLLFFVYCFRILNQNFQLQPKINKNKT